MAQRRFSHAIAEGDGISVVASVEDPDAARAAEEQRAEAKADEDRAARESAAEAEVQRAESDRLKAAKQEIRLEQQARSAEAKADALDPEEER